MGAYLAACSCRVPCCSKIVEAETVVSVNEKEWLVMPCGLCLVRLATRLGMYHGQRPVSHTHAGSLFPFKYWIELQRSCLRNQCDP